MPWPCSALVFPDRAELYFWGQLVAVAPAPGEWTTAGYLPEDAFVPWTAPPRCRDCGTPHRGLCVSEPWD